jgi:hypothetical protein
MRRRLIVLGLALLAMLVVVPAAADPVPDQPIMIAVPGSYGFDSEISIGVVASEPTGTVLDDGSCFWTTGTEYPIVKMVLVDRVQGPSGSAPSLAGHFSGIVVAGDLEVGTRVESLVFVNACEIGTDTYLVYAGLVR